MSKTCQSLAALRTSDGFIRLQRDLKPEVIIMASIQTVFNKTIRQKYDFFYFILYENNTNKLLYIPINLILFT